MKFSMNSQNLVGALDKMHRIATKGIKHEYDLAGRVTIEAEHGKVLFRASNGHLFGLWEVTETTDNAVKGAIPGIVTVDANVLRNVVKALGDDVIVDLEAKNNTLLISAASGRKRRAKIETLNKGYDFKIKKSNKGFSYTFPVDIFRQAITLISKYASNLSYRVEYQMICLHFLRDEVRFICGNGPRFAILSFLAGEDGLPATGIQEDNGVEYLIPVDQANIIANIVESSAQKISIRYESETSCLISPFDGMEMHLKGIPDVQFIKYESHADNRDDEIEAILTMSCDDYINGIKLVNAVRDKAIETEGSFHSALFEISEGSDFKFEVNERRFSCEFETPADFKKVKNRTEFKSEYAASWLADVADACSGRDVVEFSCIDEYGTILAEPKYEKGNNNPRLRFFFASALEEADDN